MESPNTNHHSSHYAYGPDRAAIETVMRLQAVKRWHMIDTNREQTLAEHSANVALLAYGIAVNCPGMFFGSADAVAGQALLHDLPEVFTGDVPSHTKNYLQGLEELEASVLPTCYTYRPGPGVRLMVKLCDLADGIRHIRLHGCDITARHAQEGLEGKLRMFGFDASQQWPKDVYAHVSRWVTFYAYEYS